MPEMIQTMRNYLIGATALGQQPSHRNVDPAKVKLVFLIRGFHPRIGGTSWGEDDPEEQRARKGVTGSAGVTPREALGQRYLNSTWIGYSQPEAARPSPSRGDGRVPDRSDLMCVEAPWGTEARAYTATIRL